MVGDNRMTPNGHERIWVSIPPVLLTAQGGAQGKIKVTDTVNFRVNMIVSIGDPVLPYLQLKVKRVDSPTDIILGPVDKSVGSKDFVDLSAYGVTSFLFAQEQTKKHPSTKEIDESTFEQEPVLARRSVIVDEYGRIIGQDNPLNVTGNISVTSQKYDDVVLTRDSDGDIVLVQKYLATVLMRTQQLFYNQDKDLIEVKDI